MSVCQRSLDSDAWSIPTHGLVQIFFEPWFSSLRKRLQLQKQLLQFSLRPGPNTYYGRS